MNFRELALAADEGQRFDVSIDGESREMGRADVLADEATGGRTVAHWRVSAAVAAALEVECGGPETEGGQVSVTEAAEILGVSNSRVKYLLKKGMLSGSKLGYRWCVDRASVEARAANPPRPGRRGRNAADAVPEYADGRVPADRGDIR